MVFTQIKKRLSQGDSQLRHVPGDAFGQRVKVLVAAAHHRLQAGALGGTLRLGNAARLLLACGEEERGGDERRRTRLSDTEGPEVRRAKKVKLDGADKEETG